ncbi:unnamed protein product, partial [Rotaria sordida]
PPLPPQPRPLPPHVRPPPSQAQPLPPQLRPFPPQAQRLPSQLRPFPPQAQPLPPQLRPLPPQARSSLPPPPPSPQLLPPRARSSRPPPSQLLPQRARPSLSAQPPPPPRQFPPRARLSLPVRAGDQRKEWCGKCCCGPEKSLLKKVVYKQIDDDKQHEKDSFIDYGSIFDKLETRITVRCGNDIMKEGDEKTFTYDKYNEKLRIIDIPVGLSGKSDDSDSNSNENLRIIDFPVGLSGKANKSNINYTI